MSDTPTWTEEYCCYGHEDCAHLRHGPCHERTECHLPDCEWEEPTDG